MAEAELASLLERWRLAVTIGMVVWALLAAKVRHPLWIVAGTAVSLVYLWGISSLPLGRLYALGIGNDRLMNLALCTPVAAGSPFYETYQVEQANFEPFWSLLVAALSGWSPDRVLLLYPVLSLGVLWLLVLSLYLGTRPEGSGSVGAWSREERGLIVYFALLLSTGRADVEGLYASVWSVGFMLKPNHTLAWVLLPSFLATLARARSWPGRLLAAGLFLTLGLAFVLHWVYVGVGLLFYVWLSRRRDPAGDREALITSVLVLGVSLAALSPYLGVLWRDYRFLLQFPTFVLPSVAAFVKRITLDQLGLLLVGGWGAAVLFRREDRLSRLWLSVGVGGAVVWTAHIATSFLGTAKEADEAQYFLRIVTAIFAAVGAWDVAARVGARRPRTRPWLVPALLLLSLPAAQPTWWNPLTMDRYFVGSLAPLPEEVVAMTTFIRRETEAGSTFVAARDQARFVAALGARRVLSDGYLRPPPEASERMNLQRGLIREGGRATIDRLRRRYGVRYVLVSDGLRRTYGPLRRPFGERPGWKVLARYDGASGERLVLYELQTAVR